MSQKPIKLLKICCKCGSKDKPTVKYSEGGKIMDICIPCASKEKFGFSIEEELGI